MKLTPLVGYFTQFLKKYNDIRVAQMKNTFRVASIKQSKGGTKIIFQVIGKSTFMECTPAEILSNDAFAEQFSKKDIQQITYALAQEEKLKKTEDKKMEIIEQNFNFIDNKTTFALRDKTGNTTFKTAAEISLDKKIVNKLSQQDAIKIGYVAGYEHSQEEPTE